MEDFHSAPVTSKGLGPSLILRVNLLCYFIAAAAFIGPALYSQATQYGLHQSKEQASILNTLSVALGVGAAAWGYFLDRFGARLTLTLIIVFACVAFVAGGSINRADPWALVWIWALIALVLSGISPALVKVVSEWLPPSLRSLGIFAGLAGFIAAQFLFGIYRQVSHDKAFFGGPPLRRWEASCLA